MFSNPFDIIEYNEWIDNYEKREEYKKQINDIINWSINNSEVSVNASEIVIWSSG